MPDCVLQKLDKPPRPRNNRTAQSEHLQGGVQFPTGGKAREPKGMNRCNSGADRTVGMKEDLFVLLQFLLPARICARPASVCGFMAP